jgi:hypothetical protein
MQLGALPPLPNPCLFGVVPSKKIAAFTPYFTEDEAGRRGQRTRDELQHRTEVD